jgi:ankyrin repeat protein
LLEHVANLGGEDDDRQTAFQIVSEFVNARDVYCQTPLHFASEGSHRGGPDIAVSFPDVARLLLEHGADVNARGIDLSTPLHVAAQYGRVEVVRVLLEHRADVGAEDDDGKTASRVASEMMGRGEITKLLSGHGAGL